MCEWEGRRMKGVLGEGWRVSGWRRSRINRGGVGGAAGGAPFICTGGEWARGGKFDDGGVKQERCLGKMDCTKPVASKERKIARTTGTCGIGEILTVYTPGDKASVTLRTSPVCDVTLLLDAVTPEQERRVRWWWGGYRQVLWFGRSRETVSMATKLTCIGPSLWDMERKERRSPKRDER